MNLDRTKVAELLVDASTRLRGQEALISELNEKLAAYEVRDRSAKIAAEMHRKGISLEKTAEELIDELTKAASKGKLSVIEESVGWFGPDMGQKVAQIAQDPEPGSYTGTSELELHLLGQLA